jgi:hypothetical protein
MRCSTHGVAYVVPSDGVVMRMAAATENLQFNVGLTPLGGRLIYFTFTKTSVSHRNEGFKHKENILYICFIDIRMTV